MTSGILPSALRAGSLWSTFKFVPDKFVEPRRPAAAVALHRHLASTKHKKATARVAFSCLAGGEGFEPPLAESESAVLPLDDPPEIRPSI